MCSRAFSVLSSRKRRATLRLSSISVTWELARAPLRCGPASWPPTCTRSPRLCVPAWRKAPRPRCSPTWRCRCRSSSARWKTSVSPLTRPCLKGCPTSSARLSMPRAREHGLRRDARSTCRAPSSSRSCSSITSACLRRRRRRPGTRRMLRPWRTCTRRPPTRGERGTTSSVSCLPIVTASSSSRWSTPCPRPSPPTDASTRPSPRLLRPRVASRLPIRTCRTSPRAVPTVCEFAAPSSLVRDSSRS